MNKKTPYVAAAILAAALAACGGDDDSPDAGAAPPATGAISSEQASAQATSPAGDAPAAAAADENGGASAGFGDLSDPCSLISLPDLAAALGIDFEPGELTHHEETGSDQCVWGAVDGMSARVFSLVVQSEVSDAFESSGYTVERLFEETKGYATVDEELDLGDTAYRTGGTIAVLADGVSFEFSAVGATSDEAIAGVRQLAEQVIQQYAP